MTTLIEQAAEALRPFVENQEILNALSPAYDLELRRAAEALARIESASGESGAGATCKQSLQVRQAVSTAISRADSERVPEGYGLEVDGEHDSDWSVYLADAAIAAYRAAAPQPAGVSEEMVELRFRLKCCELSLGVFDESRSSEYWLRYPKRVNGE